jgi:hypothetical protein
LARRAGLTVVVLGLALAAVGVPSALAAGTATDDSYTVDEDTTLMVDPATGMLANDSADPEQPFCIISIDTTGLAGTVTSFDALDGRFEFVPNPDSNGVTSFDYTLGAGSPTSCDADGGDSGTVTITVNPVNDRPVAQSDTVQALRDQTLNVAAPGVLANDFDVDGDGLSAVKESNPSHGTVTLAPDGGFSYTPAAGYVGPDGFSYRASDGSANSPARVVSITVTQLATPAPSVAPTATPAPPATPTAEPSSAASAEPSASLDASAAATSGSAPGASPSPAASLEPGLPVAEEGGLSIPVLVIGLVLASLLAFGGALLLPKWLEQRRRAAEGPFDDADGDDVDDDVDDRSAGDFDDGRDAR